MNKSTFIKLFMALVAVLFFANCGDDDSSGPTLSVSPTSVTLDESNSATLTVSSNTSWNVASSDSWLNCSPSGATGGAQVKVTANSVNNTGSARTATLTFTDKTGTKRVTAQVTQNPVKNDDPTKPDEPEAPTLTVSKSSIQFGADGGNETFTIESNTSWTVSSSESWCTVSTPSGSNNGTVTVTAAANTVTSQRTATITVKTDKAEIEKTIAVSQQEKEEEPVPTDPFDEPYLGWATSPSTVGAILEGRGYRLNEYTTQSESIISHSDKMDYMTVYHFKKTRLYDADVWIDASKYSMSQTRNYLSTTLKYTSTGTTTSSGTTYYNYLSLDGLTKASVYKYTGTDATYTIITFESSGTGLLFEEPFMTWDASMNTAKTAIENMGYTVKVDGTDLWTDSNKPKYGEYFISYWFGSSNELYRIVVYFDENKYTKNEIRNYLTNTLKYTFQREDGEHSYFNLPDGNSTCDFRYNSEYVWIAFNPVSTSAPSMAKRIERDKAIENKIRQQRLRRNR